MEPPDPGAVGHRRAPELVDGGRGVATPSTFITGSIVTNHPVVLVDGIRSYRDVAVITHDAFPDRFLKITAGVCFGDSGGPLFHEDTVVAPNSWTFSYRCAGPNLEYGSTRPRPRPSGRPTCSRPSAPAGRSSRADRRTLCHA